MQFTIGLILLALSCLGYWHALPRDGEVRGYLRNDHVQAYYTVALIGGLVSGILLTVLGLVSLFR
jgi:hypothetical protein